MCSIWVSKLALLRLLQKVLLLLPLLLLFFKLQTVTCLMSVDSDVSVFLMS